MENRSTLLLLIIIFGILLFFSSNHYLRGYLRSEVSLAKELKSPIDSVQQYKIASQAPFKYRILFPAIIKGSHALFYNQDNREGFFYTYKAWSLLFYITSACLMFWLLTICGFTNSLSFAGSLMFLLLPPMLLAFTLPVHTREDTLAYTLFFLGLIFLLKNKKWIFLLIALLGVLCRETLLLLPLLYFFYSIDRNLLTRFLIAAVPGLLWISLRLIMGSDQYDVWEGFKWNISNPEQVIGFTIITFNVCWIPFLLYMFYDKDKTKMWTGPRRFFQGSAWFTLFVILITTFVGGIYNEIRLLYLYSPWMIVFTLSWIDQNQTEIRLIIKKRNYQWFAIFSLVVCGVLLFLFLKYQTQLIVPGKYAVPYHLWIIFSVWYIFIMMLFFPLTMSSLLAKMSLKRR